MFVSTTAAEAEALTRLREIARAPWAAVPPGPAPPVELGLLSADFDRTTGRRLELPLRWENDPDGGDWLCDVQIDGTWHGTGRIDTEVTPDEALVLLTDDLCEHLLHEEVWGGWPLCPRHRTQPMWATVDDDGTAVWVCKADPLEVTPIGRLGSGPQPSAQNGP